MTSLRELLSALTVRHGGIGAQILSVDGEHATLRAYGFEDWRAPLTEIEVLPPAQSGYRVEEVPLEAASWRRHLREERAMEALLGRRAA